MTTPHCQLPTPKATALGIVVIAAACALTGQAQAPHVRAAEHLAIDTPAMRKLAAAGITAVLAVPSGPAFAGQSALVNVALPEDEPQIGSLADIRAGRPVLRTPVAIHLAV